MIAHEVCKKAIEVFGINSQIWMAIEECSELQDALAKFKRGRAKPEDVITEIADVQIMMEQLAIFFGEKEVNDERIRKLERLQKRIDKKMNEDT